MDVLGERWTVLILRELLLGPKRFTEILGRMPAIGPIAPGRLSGLALEYDADTGERFSMTVGDGALRVRSAPKRVIAEGDLVAVNSHYTTAPNTRGRAVIDPFRVRDQKIVEHLAQRAGRAGDLRQRQHDVLTPQTHRAA